MATRVLTTVAPSASHVARSAPPGRDSDWRAVLTNEDSEQIWHKLQSLVTSVVYLPDSAEDNLVQSLFLELLTEDRLRYYLESNLSDAEIELDLVSRLKI